MSQKGVEMPVFVLCSKKKKKKKKNFLEFKKNSEIWKIRVGIPFFFFFFVLFCFVLLQ